MSTRILVLVCFVAFLLGAVDLAQASSVSADTAARLVQGWINSSSKPLGTAVDRVETVSASTGETLYYVVFLKPQGYVVVSADDTIEPIICFSQNARFSAAGPLGAMLKKDLVTRQNIVATMQRYLAQPTKALASTSQAAEEFQAVLADAQSKWSTLLNQASSTPVRPLATTSDRRKAVLDQGTTGTPVADGSTGYAPGGFDVWIDPLIRSAWNQSKILNYSWAANLYNILTPSNRPAGCVAVAMAQVMRYHVYPAGVTLGATSNYYELNNAGDPTDTNVLWANFVGSYTNLAGVQSITNMPLDPANSFTPTGPATVQWSNIAALVYDAGLSVNTAYGTNLSGATYSKIVTAMTSVFRYANAVYAPASNNYINIIDRNLMGYKPVMLGISSSGVTNSGHMLVVDGFAYSAQGTLFHHLNLGWGEIGDSTAWYNLPSVIAYNTIDQFVYNIFPTNAGELIVGRVTNSIGGVTGVTVVASGVTNTTDSRGFFGIIVSPNTTNVVTASKEGYVATVVSNLVVGSSSGNTQGNVFTPVYLSQGSPFVLTAGTFSTNILLEWTNPTNSSYSGLAQILWTTNSTQEWLTWSAPTGAIIVGAATNKYPTNNVVSGGSLGGAASTLSFVQSNLTLGVTYYYSVWLTNSSGWVVPTTPGSIVTAQAKPDAGNLTMYFQDSSSARLVKCFKFSPDGNVKLSTTVADTNMVAYGIAAVGDFNSDNVDDILFQRTTGTNAAPNVGSASNSWYVWFMKPSGKLSADTLVNTNDLTAGGALTVRGIGSSSGSNAVIVTRSPGGWLRSFSATNGVIDASVTNYSGSVSVTNAIGWQTAVGATIR